MIPVQEAYLFCAQCPDSKPLGLMLYGKEEGFFYPPDVHIARCKTHGPLEASKCERMESIERAVMRVARWECSTHGHSITDVVVLGKLAPQRVICVRCGASWAIASPDLDWGE